MAAVPNGPVSVPTVRPLVVTVKLNGQALPGVKSVKVTNSAHPSSDTFSVTIALQNQPASSNLAALGANRSDEIEIILGIQGGASQSVITGAVDHVDARMLSQTATLTGRDYSAPFLDHRTVETFQNQTASDVASTLSARRGLTAQVTPTKTPLGTGVDGANTRTTGGQTEWDLLSGLARDEDFDVFVRGQNLIFRPAVDPVGGAYTVIWVPPPAPGLPPACPVKDLRLGFRPPLARGIEVTSISHDSSTGKVSQTTVTTPATGKPGNAEAKVGGAQQYTVDQPGRSSDQTNNQANKFASDFAMWTRSIEIDLPGDPALSSDRPLVLSGTGSPWDQPYAVDTIEWSYTYTDGLTMSIKAKQTRGATQ